MLHPLDASPAALPALNPTLQAQRRLAALAPGAPLPAWSGHVHSAGAALKQDSRHRPMDLRAVGGSGGSSVAGLQLAPAASSATAEQAPPAGWEALLRAGSAVAAEARAAVRAEAGYRCSAGIACNKALAKLCRRVQLTAAAPCQPTWPQSAAS